MFPFAVPKLTDPLEHTLLRRLKDERTTLDNVLSPRNAVTQQCLHYRTAGGRYFKIFVDRPIGSESTSNKSKYLREECSVHAVIAVLSSSLWWWYYTLHYDMYNCKDYMMYAFPYDYDASCVNDELADLGKLLVDSLFRHAEAKTQQYETTGERKQILFRPSLSKDLIDRIDGVLANHYGWSAAQLDFITQYDIKYRMGDAAQAEE